MNTKQVTDNKIITAFKTLLREEGYEKTTTRKIAELAGVNEVTIFRHYKKKENILKAVILGYLDQIEHLNSTFVPTGDIERDLVTIAKAYYKQINKNRDFFLLGLRMVNQTPVLNDILTELPRKTHSLVIHDFKQLQAHGEINNQVNVSAEAHNFLFLNYGHFIYQSFYQLDDDFDAFINNNVKNFAQHLK